MKKRKHSFLLKLAMVLMALYLGLSIVSLQSKLAETNAERELLEREVAEREIKNEEMRRLLDLTNDADYARAVAREKLGMASPDETIYKVSK